MTQNNSEIQEALDWFGISATPQDCDVCENGDVYFGLIKITNIK